MADFPQTREETARFDEVTRKWNTWVRVALALAPVLLFAPLWRYLREVVGYEGAVLFVVVSQVLLVAVVADRAVYALARQDMLRRRVRKSQL
jgi:hypothetical protein